MISRKIIPIFLIILFVASSFPLFSTDVSATTLNCTWKPTSGILASTAANWENGSAPAIGDNIYFISSWTTSCTYDITTSVGAFNIRTGYSGTITQAASFSVTDYSQAAGIFTGSTSYVLSDSGSFTQTDGTITTDVLRVKFAGEGTSITLVGVYFTVPRFFGMQISANVTLLSFGATAIFGAAYLTVDTGKTLTLTTTKKLSYLPTPTSSFTNNGIITGAGTLMVWVYAIDQTMILGVINSLFQIYDDGSSTANRVITLGANANLGSTFSISSMHATHTATLNLNGYSLSAAGITIGTRGIITAGTSTITNSGNWDSSASSDVASSLGTAKVHLTGVSKTFKQSSVERIGSLFVDTGSSYTLQSNIYCINYWLNGTVTKAEYTVYVNNDQASVFTSTPITQIYAGIVWTYTAITTDREAETRAYSLFTNLTGANINSGTGIIGNITPSYQKASYYLIVNASDGNHTTSQSFTLYVIWGGIFISTPITDCYALSYWIYYAETNNTCVYSLTTNATWVSYTSTGIIYGVLPYGQNASRYWTFSLMATNSYGHFWQNWTVYSRTNTTTIITIQTDYTLHLLIIGMGFLIIGMIVAFSIQSNKKRG